MKAANDLSEETRVKGCIIYAPLLWRLCHFSSHNHHVQQLPYNASGVLRDHTGLKQCTIARYALKTPKWSRLTPIHDLLLGYLKLIFKAARGEPKDLSTLTMSPPTSESTQTLLSSAVDRGPDTQHGFFRFLMPDVIRQYNSRYVRAQYVRQHMRVVFAAMIVMFIAFVLMLLVALSLPIIKPVFLLSVVATTVSELPETNLATELRFGVWGFCATR